MAAYEVGNVLDSNPDGGEEVSGVRRDRGVEDDLWVVRPGVLYERPYPRSALPCSILVGERS